MTPRDPEAAERMAAFHTDRTRRIRRAYNIILALVLAFFAWAGVAAIIRLIGSFL